MKRTKLIALVAVVALTMNALRRRTHAAVEESPQFCVAPPSRGPKAHPGLLE